MTAASNSDARKRHSAQVDPVEVVARALGDRCSECLRIKASADDWDRYEEGGGEHLCWESQGGGCSSLPTISLSDIVVTALRAEGLLS